MFSFGESSYESRLMELLQDNFFRTANRNKIIAKWAAGRLGYNGNEIDRYVKHIIFSYLMSPSDRRLIDRIHADFKAANIPLSENDIREKMKNVESRIREKSRYNEQAN
ncbi:MAG: DUF1476 domain-containing protein [Holosporaceae bacterium]|jgi:hypothetical protein|nr:DUF1476 domain-containing protein [Holosporaceae bacterium]